jgi:hypothetical protein
MAKLTLFSAFDFFSDADWSWSVRSATPTSIAIGDGVHQQTFSGAFTSVAAGSWAGSLTGSSYFLNGAEVYRLEDFTLDAAALAKLAITGADTQQTYAFFLSGDDTITGSAGDDAIKAFAGNDTVHAGAGNDHIAGGLGDDYIDGGSGLDTVVYFGPNDPLIVRTADGFKVTDADGDGTDTLVSVERIQCGDGGMIALDVDAGGVGGMAYRLYQAAFNRTPDGAGVGYWINAMDHGASLQTVAQNFIDSQEYKDAYGTGLSNHDIVTRYYENILHRAPEQGGLDFWTGALDKGVSLASVLAAISESQENIDGVAAVIGTGFEYTPWH